MPALAPSLVGIHLGLGAAAAFAGAADSAPSTNPAWEVAVQSAWSVMTERHLHDRQRNRIVAVAFSLRYQGPSGKVVRPQAALMAQDGREVGAFRTPVCRGDDPACIEHLEWLGEIGSRKTWALSHGEALTNGSLTYWFEVPRAASGLRLRFADAPPVGIVIGAERR